MKITLIFILGLLFLACSSAPKNTNKFNAYTPEQPVYTDHQNKNGGKSAIVNVALAVAIGASQKDDFECKKECEQQLKKSINKRVKKQ